ncbi:MULTISPECIES: flagellar hook-basal body complex protein FliE [Roseobacteraceae]|uniref:flagellar hook-basal body complex protein FliE n=1 Tax=Roseobacteraceae TaxID=2854170 RepID=UPI00080AAF6D|nr:MULTISPECIES: flagellar hook-basal body complex protein FliE [Roseobacteraceae]ANT63280.1 flagellar biosynthesis protein [Salipiger sp. CCB-MM3]MCA0994804.1 flagellar hook-basal body complex protein FliE [Alloyangia pacifica]NDW00457.1 flagellar biosynthesis protein [Salipiger sp. PrR002]NDW56415.1 flagellar biosynthesis protein [Salipiger sp. PrR004]
MAEPSSLLSLNSASGAYRASRDMVAEKTPPIVPEQNEGPSFSEMVAKAGAETVQTMREAEATAQTGLRGGADTQQVVLATLELESTVKVAVSVRDKLVEAYQEIMRMPV